jgi:hypothetical protein
MSIVTLNDRGVRSVSAFGSLNTGSMVFIKKLTASSSSTLSFVNGTSDVVLDSTYKEYLFTFKNIHPATDSATLLFNMSVDGGSNYNVTKTTAVFQSAHDEADTTTNLSYRTDIDNAQQTGFQSIAKEIGNGNDENAVGTLHLFNPSSTTFVKHFLSDFNIYFKADYSLEHFTAGYGNTTSAINAVQFKMDSGNIDAGDICLYGIL